MNAPHTYGEWVKLLKMLESRTNDAEVLSAMQNGTLEWQSGVAERFIKKLNDAVAARMNAAIDRFSRDQQNSMGQERILIQALEDLRKEFAFLYRCMDLPAIPEDTRKKCMDTIKNSADNVQQNLETSCGSGADRTGRLLYVVQHHRVNDF